MGTNNNVKTIDERIVDVEKRELICSQREKEIASLQKVKASLENDYKQKCQEIDKLREKILEDKSKEIVDSNNKLSKVKSDIEKSQLELIRVNQDLELKKADLSLILTTFSTEKKRAIEEVLNKSINDKIQEIECNYKTFLDKTVNTVSWSKEKLDESFTVINNEFQKMHESKMDLLNLQIKDLKDATKEFKEAKSKVENIEQLKAEVNVKRQLLEKRITHFEKTLADEVEKKHSELLLDNRLLHEQIDRHVSKIRDLQRQNDELMQKFNDGDQLEKEQLKSTILRLNKRIADYNKIYREYSSDEFEALKAQAQQSEQYEKFNRELQIENSKLQSQIIVLKNEQATNDSLKFQNENLRMQLKTEVTMMAQLQKELDDLSLRVDNKKGNFLAAESIESPLREFVNSSKDSSATIKEVAWLENIMKKCEESGFVYSKRLFYSFHTSLKTSDMSPLTVLAGVSGTGKSKLPQLYSKFGGIYFLSVPVKPDWDSPQSLFGYFNSIEKRFDATTLLRALVMFQANKSKSQTKDNITDLSDRVLIVLLDEMNLAHIEQYFSDLLSKLEERRGESEDVSFEVDLGAGYDKYSVVLTDNVKWVGTMNEDETTKSLSDKVVDRGNIISFPRPNTFQRYHYTNKIIPPSDMIKRSVWENWAATKVQLTDEEIDKYMNIVISINNSLKEVNRALGHRVWQSIENYMMSHPLVKEYENDTNGKRAIALKYAFEEALVHKVMPKLRGITTVGIEREQCLDKIGNLLKDNEFTIVPDFEQALDSVTETFIWDSAIYLENEYDELN